MSFTALNLSADNAAFDAEEHTRELQIEQAFKTFQQALKYQKDRKYDEANAEFQELFKIEVIKYDSRSIITPTVRSLRYLAHRNRGLLQFEELRFKIDSLPLSKALDMLLKAINDLTSCLQYTDGDFKVMSLLLGIFKLMKSKRLARYVIEYELTKEENRDSVIHERNRKRTKEHFICEKEERKLLLEIGMPDSGSIDIKTRDLEDQNLSFLQHVIDYLSIRHEKFLNKQKSIIQITNPTWKSLATELNNLLPKSKVRNSKAKDLYFFLESPITSIALEYHDVVNFPNPPISPTIVEDNDSEVKVGVKSGDDPSTVVPKQSDDMNKKEDIQEELKVEKSVDNEEVVETKEEADFVESNTETGEGSTSQQLDERVISTDLTVKKRAATDDVPQRSSKRVRQLTEIENATEANCIDHESFVHNLNIYLEKVGAQFQFDIVTIQSFQEAHSELYLYDFYNALHNWNSRLTDILFQDSTEADSSEIALTELFNSSTFTGGLLSNGIMKELDDSLAADFIENHQNLHYIHLRTSFLQSLLSQKQTCPITDLIFEKDLYDSVENLVLISEETIFSEFKSATFQDYGISVFEVLLNSWISLKQRSKARGLSSKQQSDMFQQIEVLHPIVLRWKKFIEDQSLVEVKLVYRFKWCSLLYLQHSQISPIDYTKDQFNNFYFEISNVSDSLNIPNPNYEFIPSLNLTTIKSQSDKLNVITSFEKSLNSGESEDTVNLLESLLLSKSTDNLSEEKLSMIRFINDSSIALKLKLWKILFHFYSKTSKLVSYARAFSMVLPLLFEQICSNDYSSQSENQRQQVLVTTIAYFGDYISGFAQLLQENGWKLDDFISDLLQKTLDVFKILYPYCLFESSLKIHNRNGSKSTSRIRNIVIETLSVIFALFLSGTELKDQLEFYNVIHAEVGNMSFCDAGNGRLLKIGQDVLKTADIVQFEAELLQHLNCRFHLFITSDTFIPFEHQTTKTEFNKESALEFSDYILDSILRKKNILFQSSLKPDLKNALETLYKAFGDPDLDHSPYQRNDNMLHLFLETNLDLRVFRDALTGTVSQQFRKSTRPEQHVFDKGVYYLEGLTNLNIYRVRRKAAQAKGSDLEHVIKMFKCDLVIGSNRAETWFSLAEAYALLVEDDLTWTADKLNSPEKKLATANTQRRSLLCYLMAVSVLVNSTSDCDESLKAALFSSLSREVYHALFTPMNSLCFLTASERKFLANGNIVDITPEITDSTKVAVLKIVEKMVLVAISLDKSDWQNYLLLSKIRRKLKYSAIKVINSVSKSCELNNTQIEPLYSLCSNLYKYVKNGSFYTKKAIERIKGIPLFNDIPTNGFTEDNCHSLIILCLRKLISIDKKKWHHKPRYRIAKILYEKGDYKSAYDEIEPIVILKSTNKNLISIWRPELEPAGKHFSYTSKYIDFYLDVAERLFQLQNLVLFTKKLRRFGASMVDLPTHWDKAISKVCMLVKELVDAKAGYTDDEVPKLKFTELMQKSDLLANMYKGSAIKHEEIPLLVLMLEIYELRKMNNGFGSTSLIDDTFNCVYLKFFLKKEANGELELPEKPIIAESNTKSATVKSKVARRDILSVAASFSKILEVKLKSERITDDKGFQIPTELREAHISADETPEPTKDLDNSEIFLTPNSRTPVPNTPDATQDTPIQDTLIQELTSSSMKETDAENNRIISAPEAKSTSVNPKGDMTQTPSTPVPLNRGDTEDYETPTHI